MLTLRQAAEQCGITYSTARTIAAEYDVGTLLTPRQRLLSAEDVERLRSIAAERQANRGFRGPRDESGRFTSSD